MGKAVPTQRTIERLETRRLLSAAVDGATFGIRGTPGDDVITISLDGTTATIVDNGVNSTVDVPRGKQLRAFLGDGNDQLTVTLVGRSIPATVYGGAGNDRIDFLALGETLRLYGEDGADELLSFRSTPANPESLRTFSYGGVGDDEIGTGPGRNLMYGGDGNDRFTGSGTDTINAGDGNDSIFADQGNDSIFGEGGDDSIVGGDGADTIDGGLGNDLITGDFSVVGENQPDLITGGAGADFFFGNEIDTGEVTDFAAGEDDYTAKIAVSGNTLTILGSMRDEQFQIRFLPSAAIIAVNYPDPSRLVTFAGGSFPIASVHSIRIFGSAGDDDIDLIDLPESIGVTVYGGGGDDVLATQSNAGTLRFYGEAGNDAAGSSRFDPVIGRRFLYGGSGNDSLRGGPQNDLLFGDAGDDTLIAGGGNDQLSGGSGADQLFGDRGNDNLAGGAGIDSITGGSNADEFTESERLAGEVLDFTAGVDTSN